VHETVDGPNPKEFPSTSGVHTFIRPDAHNSVPTSEMKRSRY